VVLARSDSGEVRLLNLTRDGDEVSIVDVTTRTLRVVPLAGVEAAGAGLGEVYALVFDRAGLWFPLRAWAAPVTSEAGDTLLGDSETGEVKLDETGSDVVSETSDDGYQKAADEQAVRIRELMDDLASHRDIRVWGMTGWLRQTFDAMLWLGGLVSAAKLAELAAVSKRDIVALTLGPKADNDPRWWRFRPSGRPLPVRIEDLPPDAQAAFAELAGPQRS
jgi:hypothetical protein